MVLKYGVVGNLVARVLNRFRLLPRFSLTGKVGRVRIPIRKGLGYDLLNNSEPWLDSTLRRLLRARAGPFLDIGVNIGQTLVKVMNVDADRDYWGFEPNPSAVAYVNSLTIANRLSDVHVICAGLSDHDGTTTLFLASDCDSSASIVEGFRPAEYYKSALTVPVLAGDRFIDEMKIRGIAVIKIDVEGAELRVLRGLRRTIARDRPFIVCELLPVYDESSQVGQARREQTDEVTRFLREHGYEMVRLLPDGSWAPLNAIETHADLALTNYLFIPDHECVVKLDEDGA
jgi:FkbM family methyltransferase